MQIKDSIAVITGGASGLGEACVRSLSALGGKVAILDIAVERGEKLAAELGSNVIFVHGDVTSDEGSSAAVAKAAAAFGKINVAINCAGVADPGKILSKKGPMSLAFFNRVVQINLVGTLNIIRLAVEQMVKNTADDEGEKGVIINTASVAAFDGQIGQAAYSASKAGVAGMTLPIARECADYVRHPHDGGPPGKRPGTVGSDGSLSETARPAAGVCRACSAHHRESDAQRRVHPP
jgi:3-hydroxyacyl-CoA dehydrogenase/3-hydroxy-2-methylbutyryl-CoA dehydrogenase